MSDTFEQSFRRNMDALHLPAPDSIFTSVSVTIGSISGIAAIVEGNGGRAATMRAVIAAGSVSTRFNIAGGILATLYLGACVGSLLVATGEMIMQELTPPSTGYIVLSRALVRHQQRLRISPTASQRIVDSWRTERERYLRENPLGRRENEIQMWNGNGSDRLRF